MMKKFVHGRRRLEIGQGVSVGQDLIDILSLADVRITADVKEIQPARLWPGQSVEIKIDAWSALGRTVASLGATPNSAQFGGSEGFDFEPREDLRTRSPSNQFRPSGRPVFQCLKRC
jgi:hypothetical protein